jgi:alkanesulfonate monooxygenase SsuD/methylene tetrahydromethanopterin reductase-like flavin-dependent oxidoreductase (luciferase family)
VLCENDSEITRALDSPYIRGSALTLTPTAAHWKHWGGKHPLGDDYALSGRHRSILFTRTELLEIFKKITENDIQQIVYIGSPEEVAKRMVPWARVMGHTQVDVGGIVDFGTTIFPEHRALAADGLPRWHHLERRLTKELNRLLKEA